jgi:hypothetical protein
MNAKTPQEIAREIITVCLDDNGEVLHMTCAEAIAKAIESERKLLRKAVAALEKIESTPWAIEPTARVIASKAIAEIGEV